MFGQVIRALIYLCFMVLAFYLVLWVLGELGIRLPAMVEHILLIIFILIALLVLYQLFAPYIGTVNWWGRGPPCVVLALVGALALAGCAADRTVRDVTIGADAIHMACADAVPLAQLAVLIPGAGTIAEGIVVGCQTADGLARLAADPTSAAWLGQQTQMLRDLIARARAKAKDLRGVAPVVRIPGV